MTSIAVFGASGFAGSHITQQALSRGLNVTGVSRTPQARGQARMLAGSITDRRLVSGLAAEHDVLVVAVPAATLLDALPSLMTAAKAGQARLAVVGGAGSLLVTEGGPAFIDTPGFQDMWKIEAVPHGQVLDLLRQAPEPLDWFYLSPPAKFGRWLPGDATGAYLVGDDILLTDGTGNSEISGRDYALAFVNEIETPRHRRRRFTVARKAPVGAPMAG